MKTPWFRESCFRNLVDMHINNGDPRLLASFNADVYADNMVRAGFDTVYIYASNCLGLCLYPTQSGIRHQIAETRDLFGETVSACRKRGLGVVGYLNHWGTASYDQHPEWRVVGPNGKGSRDSEAHGGRYGVCCMNSPYSDRIMGMVTEVCGQYDLDGFWVDMVGFWRGACLCESCRRRYRELTGRDIPVTVDWTNEEWVSYIRFKQASVNQYVARIRETALAANPKLTVSIQSASWKLGSYNGLSEAYYSHFDYASGDFYGEMASQAVDSKFLSSVTSSQPFEYMVSRCPDLVYHTMTRPLWKLRQQGYGALLHGGSFMIIDAIDPAGTMDAKVYDDIRAVTAELHPFFGKGIFEGRPVSDIGVYLNYDSMINPADNGKSADQMTAASPVISRMETLAATLAAAHVSFDIVTRRDLNRLGDYGVIVLSEQYVISAEEQAAFTRFVEGGGRLFVSGRTGTLDAPAGTLSPGQPAGSLARETPALVGLTGVRIAGEVRRTPVYLEGKSDSGLFSENRLRYPYSTAGPVPQVLVEEGTRVLASLTLPVSSHDDPRNFLSAISDPPWEKTDWPSLTRRDTGKGFCVYSAALIEADPQPEMVSFFISLIHALLDGRPRIEVRAPACIEHSVRHSNGKLRLTFLNTQWARTEAVMPDITIRVPAECFVVNSLEVKGSGGSDPQAACRLESGTQVISLSGMKEFVRIDCAV